MKDLRTKFLDLFVNLPIPLRREIIVVIDNQPISWNIAYKEIKAETKLGKRILKELDTLGLWSDSNDSA
ncbi:hypothetical protein KKG83_04670 [Candidatus Micrarchaeota archaeon]|nr:hypothetical protein [Candidatus Micrarchaeota archaeon]MBU2476738.1 hypothetical protein [Candidatus Micrarchaeota archaeon]